MFTAAALGSASWDDALAGLAEATGSRSGQLIGLGGPTGLLFNWISDGDPEMIQQFAEYGGGDPARNPRVAAGLRSPTMRSVTESQFMGAAPSPDSPIYNDLFIPFDVPFICLSTLRRTSSALVGLSVLRTKRQGHISQEQQRVYDAIAPSVQAAVKLHRSVHDDAASLVVGALDAMDRAAFITDGLGRLRALTPAADAILSEGSHLVTRGRQLKPAHDDPVFAVTLWRASCGQTTAPLALRSVGAGGPLILDFYALPPEHTVFEIGAVLVEVRRRRSDEFENAPLLQDIFGLTRAEALIAVRLGHGQGAGAVAEALGVAVGTVRAHIRSILAKTETRSQLELVSRLRALD